MEYVTVDEAIEVTLGIFKIQMTLDLFFLS